MKQKLKNKYISTLYKHLTNEELVELKTIKNRVGADQSVLYSFYDIEWLLLTDDQYKKINFENYKLKGEMTNIYLLFKEDLTKVEPIKNVLIRQLNKNDENEFKIFKDNCTEEEKEEGEVYLEDALVYGAIIDNKIVSVCSTWEFGEKIVDIGILTRADYRKKGLARLVTYNLLKDIDKMIMWRATEKNIGSNTLAKKLGFTKIGNIHVIE